MQNTFEYSILDNVEPHELIKKMGEFKQDLNTPVKNYIKYQSDAFEMMLKAGWK